MNLIVVCKWIKYIHNIYIPRTVSTADTEMKAGGREGERRGWKRSEEWLQLYFQCFTCGNTPSPLLDMRGSTYQKFVLGRLNCFFLLLN